MQTNAYCNYTAIEPLQFMTWLLLGCSFNDGEDDNKAGEDDSSHGSVFCDISMEQLVV